MVDGWQQHWFQTAVISFPCQYLQELRVTDKGRENLLSWEFNYRIKKGWKISSPRRNRHAEEKIGVPSKPYYSNFWRATNKVPGWWTTQNILHPLDSSLQNHYPPSVASKGAQTDTKSKISCYSKNSPGPRIHLILVDDDHMGNSHSNLIWPASNPIRHITPQTSPHTRSPVLQPTRGGQHKWTNIQDTDLTLWHENRGIKSTDNQSNHKEIDSKPDDFNRFRPTTIIVLGQICNDMEGRSKKPKSKAWTCRWSKNRG